VEILKKMAIKNRAIVVFFINLSSFFLNSWFEENSPARVESPVFGPQ
jgi:hypothetical protein